mmetsp:Transcript_54333/g.119150  ORF Transcript_54333/g.119150 Transcript_54333/m.119150 type:complete len:678 (+) Transcript_54333:72-2105(+)
MPAVVVAKAAAADAEAVPSVLAPSSRIASKAAESQRIREIIGTVEEKKYSPRTEEYITQLYPILELYDFTRREIADLVKRCNFDDKAINMAVEDVFEDKANHQQAEFGVVLSKKQKKQLQEEKRQREKEERERVLQEERARKEEERKERERQAEEERQRAREERKVAKGKSKGKGRGGDAIFRDPAIVSATKKGGDDHAAREDWKGDGRRRQKEEEWTDDWKDWKHDDWKMDDSWRESRSNRRKDRSEGNQKGSRKGRPEPKPADDLWDTDNITVGATLDAHSRSEDLKTMLDLEQKHGEPEKRMRTVAEVEARSMKTAPKPPVSSLSQAAPTLPSGMPPATAPPATAPPATAPPVVAPLGADFDDDDRRGIREAPLYASGNGVEVKKHSSMGCAVITVPDKETRDFVVNAAKEHRIQDILVQMKVHVDKETKEEIPTMIFSAWGRQIEKNTPLSEQSIMEYVDGLVRKKIDKQKVEETARDEAIRAEVARLEAARTEAARQEAAIQEYERQEALRQESMRMEATRQQSLRAEAQKQAGAAAVSSAPDARATDAARGVAAAAAARAQANAGAVFPSLGSVGQQSAVGQTWGAGYFVQQQQQQQAATYHQYATQYAQWMQMQQAYQQQAAAAYGAGGYGQGAAAAAAAYGHGSEFSTQARTYQQYTQMFHNSNNNRQT